MQNTDTAANQNNPEMISVTVPWCFVHAAELQAVGVRLVVRGQVIVVKDSDPEHSGVHAVTQEEDGDKTRHLVDKHKITMDRF